MNPQGRFVWYDLVNEDMAKAKPFYTQAVGWKTQDWSGGNYEMWSAGEKPVGGNMQVKELPAMPLWIGYVAVDQADAAVQRAEKMGGKARVPVQSMDNGGKYAIFSDPQGAAFGIYQAPKAADAPDLHGLGQFGWMELTTTDWEAAMRFYSELFGWKVSQKMEMNEGMGTYAMFGPDANPDSMFGGMSSMAKAMKIPPMWMYYANVSDTDAVAKQVPTLGGKVINGPMDVPGGSRIAQCLDAMGGAFGLMTYGKK